jgi:hypothetical protein
MNVMKMRNMNVPSALQRRMSSASLSLADVLRTSVQNTSHIRAVCFAATFSVLYACKLTNKERK